MLKKGRRKFLIYFAEGSQQLQRKSNLLFLLN